MQAFYDPGKTYEDNFENGPFGVFADGKVFEEKEEPQFDLFGKKVYLPFGIAAGPLPNSNFVKAAFAKGFDVLHYKTQRSTVFPCNEFPNVLFLDIDGDLTIEKSKQPIIGKMTTTKPLQKISITNSFGNPSKGPGFWQDDMRKAVSYQGKGQVLIASIVGTIKEGFSQEDYYDDFALAARLAHETGVPAVELNLACPNVATEGVLCYTLDAVVAIVQKTRKVIGDTPLLIKLGYYTNQQQDLLEKIMQAIGPLVQGVSVINTIAAPIVDEHGAQALPGVGREKSGVCGASIKWAGIDMVKRLVELRNKLHQDFVIFGVGGMMTPADYFDYKHASCDVVQSVTGAMWNPSLAQEIKAAISKA